MKEIQTKSGKILCIKAPESASNDLIHFPNGFISWYETFYEVVANITFWREGVSLPKRIKTVQEEQGTGGLYELAKELTDKFELLHKGREWDGDFFDEIDKFLDVEFNT